MGHLVDGLGSRLANAARTSRPVASRRMLVASREVNRLLPLAPRRAIENYVTHAVDGSCREVTAW
jgi:hypothetical protein